MTANALRDWSRFSKADSAYIDPGHPGRPVRRELRRPRPRELLSVELFSCLAEARVLIEDGESTTTTTGRTQRSG
jgi:hypothetical protein